MTDAVYLTKAGYQKLANELEENIDKIQNRIQQIEDVDMGATSMASGTVDACIGHPIAWFPAPIANMGMIVDGINSAFNLVRVHDGAALSFISVNLPAAVAQTITGTFITVAG